MRYALPGIPKSCLGEGHVPSSLKLRNCQEMLFSTAGFKVEILKWNTGAAQNKAALKPYKMKHFTRICRLGCEGHFTGQGVG